MNCFIFLVLIIILCFITYVDVKSQLIYDQFHIYIIILALMKLVINDAPWMEALLGSIIVSLPLLCMNLIHEMMGFGDIKLFFSLGLLLGVSGILLTFKISLYSCFIFIILKRNLSMHDVLPFGPFICLGAILSYSYHFL